MFLLVVWSPAARDDLEKIWMYLAREAFIARADEQVVRIEEACRKLSVFPRSGLARDSLAQGLRSVTVPPYVVFYRANDAAVQIVRVIDGRRDIDAIITSPP